MRITDIPKAQRPRERVIESGIHVASDLELLAMIIRQGSKHASAVEVSVELLNTFGSVAELARAGIDELSAVAGIGPAKASAVAASFELARRVRTRGLDVPITTPRDVFDIVRNDLRDLRRERVLVLCCDSRDRLLLKVAVSEGAIDGATMPIREVLNAVLRADAKAFAVAHNHPSGDPNPSDVDMRTTAQLRAAAAIVGLRMLDHVIVAGDKWTSVD